jgi:hypothetical protein
MRLRGLIAVAMAVIGLAAAGCDEALSDLAGPTPNLEPTFSSIQREIFDTTDSSGRRACTNCHNPVGRPFAGGLDLTANSAYNSLVNVRSVLQPGATRVIPGDPENSYLIHKLEGRSGIFGSRMPFQSPTFLTDGQILVIKRWIALGAAND